MAIKKSKIYSTLWESCNVLRGSMDASQYKDYVLYMLFVKYISDKVKSQEDTDIELPEGCSFDDFVKLKQNAKIGELINTKLEAIRDLNNDILGDIALPNFNDSNKLGVGKTMVETLSNLIGVFEDSNLDFSKNRAADDDLLGDAYEYLMKNFAAESGKSKGQFYTPAEVSRVIAKVLNMHEFVRAQNTIYDPTCGSGSLLLRALSETPKGNLTLYGQEKDNTTASLAKLNMLLHGIVNAKIATGDTINDPKHKEAGHLKVFDVCVANPPFSLKPWLNDGGEADEYGRWTEQFLPPQKCGDYAFLLHLYHSMKSETGRGACILPHGVLFRGNAEYEIRKWFVEQKAIKAIIGLPANLFYGTGIPASIIVLDNSGKANRKGIFIIDAKDGYMKDGNKNRLREQDIRKITDTFSAMQDVPHYARMVTWSEIEANDYNLNIPRYIQPVDNEIVHDINAHINGGLPNADIDKMEEYWQACPTLRDALFNELKPGYSQLSCDKEYLSQNISCNGSFQNQKKAYKQSIAKFMEYWNAELLAMDKDSDSSPKHLIKNWGDTILDIFREDHSLVGLYSVYDNLMNYWADVLQDDCYMIFNAGWQPLGNTKKKNGIYSDIVCDLLPCDVVLSQFFSKEISGIEKKQAEIDSITSQMQSMMEDDPEHFEEYFEKVSEAAIRKALQNAKKGKESAGKDFVAIWSKYVALADKKKDADKELKAMQKELTAKVEDKYQYFDKAENLNELKELVVEHKWKQSLTEILESNMQTVTQSITASVTELVTRYENTLSDLNENVNGLEKKVMSHLNKMGFNYGK